MKKEKTIKTICTLFIIGLILTACGGAAQPAAPTATMVVNTPTAPPQPTTIPSPALPTMKEYTNPSKSFSISVPVDWTSSENTGYVFLSSPDQNAFVELLAENTISPLDADAFTKTINAFEYNIFSHEKNYVEIKREVQAGYAIISKTLDAKTIPFRAITIYEQKGKVLFVQSYYSAVSAASQSAPIVTAMANSFKSNLANAETLSPFASALITYTDPDNLYHLKIPSLWTYNDVNKNGEIIIYTSPDTNAFILLAKKDLGQTVTRDLADSKALDLLKLMYADVLVSNTETLENGSIRITWAPKAGGLQGITIYKWKGTIWYGLTWEFNAGSETNYVPVLNQSIVSFQVSE